MAGCNPSISVVVPVWNEDVRNLSALYSRLTATLDQLAQTWEIVFVDDASTGPVVAALNALSTECTAVRVIRLDRHRGQDTATVMGLLHARGTIICTMDGDLEHRPEELPMLIKPLHRGYDLVFGRRRAGPGSSITRRVFSRAITRLMNLRWQTAISDWGCAFNAGKRPIFEELRDTLPRWQGEPLKKGFIRLAARWTEVEVSHDPRQHGRSRYTWGQRWRRGFQLVGGGQRVAPVACAEYDPRWNGGSHESGCGV